ncbi:transposable element Tcb2 transposase [Trichonephila clavipes]|nr:transposable element Tcb2 transposase [Trichonephila clavipes]
MADKNILEYVQSSKNIIDEDSDGENEINTAALVSTKSEIRNTLKNEYRFRLENYSRRLLIWREQRTRYNQINIVGRDSYRSGGIMVWVEISLRGQTAVHVLSGKTLIGMRYRDELLDRYIHL